MIITVVMQRDAVELLKGICDFSHGCSETGVQGYALDLRCANVDALAFFHVPEVRSLDATALVRDHRWLHVP